MHLMVVWMMVYMSCSNILDIFGMDGQSYTFFHLVHNNSPLSGMTLCNHMHLMVVWMVYMSCSNILDIFGMDGQSYTFFHLVHNNSPLSGMTLCKHTGRVAERIVQIRKART